MSRIVLTGASGYLGGVLTRHLSTQGHEVTVISRRKPRLPNDTRFVAWDGEHQGNWTRELSGADAIINLAGRSVNCRYNEANRREILDSRLKTTDAVAEAIALAPDPPPVWLNASSATIYPDTRDRNQAEGDTPTYTGFSEEVCREWEATFFEPALPKTRRVALRTPIVFGPKAPVMQVYLKLAKFGLAGPQGDGNQFVSWVHEADFASIIDLLLGRDDIFGPVNCCAPHPLTNRQFTADLRAALGIPFGLWTPAVAMQVGAFFLRTEPELVLKSRRVVSKRLADAGFQFQFPDWPSAIRDIVSRVKSS